MIPAGCLRLPEHYGARLWSMLAKGKAHKYVRRVPIPGKTTKTGKPRYRYYYHAAHGGGVGAHEHMVEGAAFQHEGGHWHIKKTDGDTLHIEHDESGKTRTVTRAELAKMLHEAHSKAIEEYRQKALARVKEARESGASPKQIAALEEHVKRAGVESPEAKRKRVLKQIEEIERKIDPYGINTVRPKSWKPLVVSNPALYDKLRGEIHDLQEQIGQRPWQRTKEQARSLGIREEKHREMVKQAMDAGKAVPEAILAEHGLDRKEPPVPGANLTQATADDIPLSLATAAHSGTSHTPDVRAKQERTGYVDHMRNVAAQLAQYETPENSADIKAALEDYRQGYIKRLKDYLSARSRVMSTLVTGPAKFPVRANEKKNDAADSRREELLDWSDKARKRMVAEFNPEAKRAISSDRSDAVDALQSKIASLEKQQALMVAANKVYRDAKLSDDEKVKKLTGLGMSEPAARAGLKPDFAGRIGFADYATKNNAAEIRRLKERVGAVAQEQGKATTEHAFEGGRVVDDAESNRVRIYHDVKPSAQTIAELKRHGFKWTPSEGAWQRQRSDAARHHAEVITGAKVLSGAPAAPAVSKPEQPSAQEAPTPALPADKPSHEPAPTPHPRTADVMASLAKTMTPTDAERAHAAALYASVKRSKTASGAVEQGEKKVDSLKRSIESITDQLLHVRDAHKRAQDAAGPTAGERHHLASAKLSSHRDQQIAEYRSELAFLDAARAGTRKGPLSPLTAAFEELIR